MPDILHRVGVNAQPEPVLKALTTIDGVRGWWDSGAKGDAAEGGTFAFWGGQMKVLEANRTSFIGAASKALRSGWIRT